MNFTMATIVWSQWIKTDYKQRNECHRNFKLLQKKIQRKKIQCHQKPGQTVIKLLIFTIFYVFVPVCVSTCLGCDLLQNVVSGCYPLSCFSWVVSSFTQEIFPSKRLRWCLFLVIEYLIKKSRIRPKSSKQIQICVAERLPNLIIMWITTFLAYKGLKQAYYTTSWLMINETKNCVCWSCLNVWYLRSAYCTNWPRTSCKALFMIVITSPADSQKGFSC